MSRSDRASGLDAQFVGRVSPTAARIQAGGHPCQGIYWTKAGARPRTALIATHYNVDFSEHYSAPYFAERGLGFLGWNTRYRGAEDLFILEHALIDIAVGVRWLREEAGVEQVVILGNSGGGSLMGAYQAEAIAPTLAGGLQGAGAAALAALPRADLYVSLNAHRGRPEVLTDWMDASVVDETDPTLTDPALDPFNPDNGPPYSAEFIARYRAGSARAQPEDHRLGQGRAGQGQRRGRARHPVPALSHLGRPEVHGPGDRSLRAPLPRLLPRPSGGRQPHRRHRPGQHLEDLAVDVEPGDLEMPGRRPAGQVRPAVAGGAGHRRHGRLPLPTPGRSSRPSAPATSGWR